MMDDANEEAVRAMASAIGLDADEDWEILVREMELHELVDLHENLQTVLEAVEAECEFRVENDRKMVAGSDYDRGRARAVAGEDE